MEVSDDLIEGSSVNTLFWSTTVLSFIKLGPGVCVYEMFETEVHVHVSKTQGRNMFTDRHQLLLICKDAHKRRITAIKQRRG